MAEPLTKKIDTLPAATAVVSGDKLLMLDVSESPVNMTKLMTMSQVPISLSSQLAAGVVDSAQIKAGAVTEAKLGTNSVTEAKLGTIKRTVVIRVMSPEDTLTVGSTNNFFPFPVSLNNFKIIDARMNLSVASTSGSVTVLLKNQGGTMTTLTLAAGATGMSASGSISTSYRTAVTNNFLGVECTAAGTGAKGLTVTLVLEGVPA